jgi:hypothetical protein
MAVDVRRPRTLARTCKDPSRPEEPDVAPTRVLTELVLQGDAGRWRAAGFTVTRRGRIAVDGLTLRLAPPVDDPAIVAWHLEPPWPHPIDGLPVAPPDAHRPRTLDVEHPNGVVALDHVVVTTSDVARTTGALVAAGLAPRRTLVGARGDDETTYRFFLLGTCVLELVGPTRTEGDAPARFAGLAFTTSTIARLGPFARPPVAAIQPGRRIATLDPAVGVGIPIVFLSPRVRG